MLIAPTKHPSSFTTGNADTFLSSIIFTASTAKLFSTVVIELRTRDIGKTNLDVSNSCQLVDNVWVPYIVLNYQELKDFLLKNESIKNSKITLNREYTILGGKNGRY